MRHLLEGGVYSDLGVNLAVLVKGRRLYEVKLLLEEMRYLKVNKKNVFQPLKLHYNLKNFIQVFKRIHFQF